MSVVALGADPEDGGPVWAPARGTDLVPGQLAWAPLATGHHCQTWLCWSVELWVPTLVKLARPGWSRPRWTRALQREARALRPLRHPAFPRLLADASRTDQPHLVLEYLDGPALDQALDADGPLSGADTARLAVGLLAALRGLHATGIAHLDVCPDNVLLVERRVRLIDLGAARPLGRLLRRGEEAGTDNFIAPELAAAAGGPVTAAMDVYSVGATLRAVLDPAEATGPLADALGRLTAADPADRPTVDRALALLVRYAGRRSRDAAALAPLGRRIAAPHPSRLTRSPGAGAEPPSAGVRVLR